MPAKDGGVVGFQHVSKEERRACGRIGALTTLATHGGEAMTRSARRGFLSKFENEAELRAHMARLRLKAMQKKRKGVRVDE